jgi:adenylosuccinate synthase
MSKLYTVVGGQFGSEAKGHVAAILTQDWDSRGMAIRVGGPNAGHTVVDSDGRAWPLRQIPVAAVNSDGWLGIAAGSEVDLSVLLREIDELDEAGYRVSQRLFIDPQATIIDKRHQNQEGTSDLIDRTGSTGKGIGAARAERIWREAQIAADMPELNRWTSHRVARLATAQERVLIEGTQGFGLGLHAGFYPQCTGSDCTAIDFQSMAGLSPWSFSEQEVWVVFRPYPIRVAGNSGPLLGETTWEDLGLPVEKTTVTQKVRRVGGWDWRLYADALYANGYRGGDSRSPIRVALTMADQIDPDYQERYTMPLTATSDRLTDWVDTHMNLVRPSIITTSPFTHIRLPGRGA